jgi:two-component system invasion response regulator UvrY
MRLRVLIVDDHAIVRRGLCKILEESPDLEVAGEAATPSEALDLVRRGAFDAAVVDLSLGGKSGFDLLRQIHSVRPKLPVLVLTVHPEDQYAVRSLRAGARGFLNKESAPEELVRAIRRISAGGRYVSEAFAERLAGDLQRPADRPPHDALSDREFEVLRRIASGRTVSQIASDLGLSVKTVSTYRARVLRKMDMETNAQLTSYAIRSGLVD